LGPARMQSIGGRTVLENKKTTNPSGAIR